MIIKEVSTDCFAGIHEKTGDDSITLDPGLNVIWGKNETGKSTLVNLISRTLFQMKRDKGFKDGFFPADGSSDTVNGALKLEKDGVTYLLSRTWNKDKTTSNSRLEAEGGRGLNTTDETVQEELGKLLGFGEGVYTELLLSPQKDAADNLKYLIEGTDKDKRTGKQELAAVVTQALDETGGYSMAKFERALQEKIDRLAGKYWDIAAGRPINKKNGERYTFSRNDTNNELLRRAYFAVADAKKARDAKTAYDKARAFAEALEKKRDDFLRHKGKIEALKSYEREEARLKAELPKLETALARWPELEKTAAAATVLEKELEGANVRKKFAQAAELSEAVSKARSALGARPFPAREDIDSAADAEEEIRENTRKLTMELSAKLELEGGHTASVRSVRTGGEIDINAPITEAVVIEVPGVMKMTLAPAMVDADAVQSAIAENEAARDGVFAKFGVSSVKELRALAEEKLRLENELTRLENKYDMVLDGEELSALEAKAAAVGETRAEAEISADIAALCGGRPIHDLIVGTNTELEGFRSGYTSAEALSERISSEKMALQKAQDAVEAAGSIPPEYMSLDEQTLRQSLEQARAGEKRAWDSFREDLEQLSALYMEHSDDLDAAVADCERSLDEKRTELARWLHVREAYEEIRNSEPYKGLAEKFGEYLARISDSADTTDIDGSSLDFGVNGSMGFGLLSEGTKETVYLAFRLAVLDYLFPDGGGIIVLDDPLNDMDPDRVKQSCKLIAECAQRHQVILLTCREEYIARLAGCKVYRMK